MLSLTTVEMLVFVVIKIILSNVIQQLELIVLIIPMVLLNIQLLELLIQVSIQKPTKYNPKEPTAWSQLILYNNIGQSRDLVNVKEPL